MNLSPKFYTFSVVFFLCLSNIFSQHVISSFSPASGYPRSIVTISGSNLTPLSGSAHVFFGTAKAQVLSSNSFSLTVKVPFGATVGPITISMNGFTVASLTDFVPIYPASTAFLANLNFFPTEGNLNLTYNAQTLNAYNVADFDNDGKMDLVAVLN
ncbi:MAG: IPT/TIG domain-containing protein [Bacteroidia bacterium]|nr:IPT/TIG domain-containing protein [Bacteroidia bacterium]